MRTRRPAFRGGALTSNRRDERGYVTIILAIILPVLFVSAAFTVDFGSWYARAAELKRGADAAALAGVVWMPDFTQAKMHALTAAQRNGFQDGVNNITVSVDQVPGKDRQLSVTITDNKAAQIFSSLVFKGQKIARTSTAEYVLPVPLGSPKNTFGTGDLPGSTDNVWAAVSGYCSGHENGDDRLAKYETLAPHNVSDCQPSGVADNAAYDPGGYLYAIDLPQDVSSLKLDVYDAPFYRTTPTVSRSDLTLTGSPSVTTYFQVYERNPTPLDLSNLTPAGPAITYSTNDNSLPPKQNAWVNLHTWTGFVEKGQYYVRVWTKASEPNSRASNGFGLRAYTTSTWTSTSLCTTILNDPGYSASCPQVHGVTDMSIFANLSGTATFYLAQIDPVHAGKTMRINLFDPGEGAASLSILDPSGHEKQFSWSTPCPNLPPPRSLSIPCSGSNVSSLTVSDTGPAPYAGWPDSYTFNDRYVTVDVKVPNDYTGADGTWWKVKYVVGGDPDRAPTDRTTWSVNIVGDPVHLLK
jgi:Flp pilus assembly protein TadG